MSQPSGPRTKIRVLGVIGLFIAIFLFISSMYVLEVRIDNESLALASYALLLGGASVGLLGARSWARVLAILLAVVALIELTWSAYDSLSHAERVGYEFDAVVSVCFMFPFGYALWCLSQSSVKQEFSRARGLEHSSGASEKIVLHYVANWCLILIFINIVWFVGILQASPVNQLGWSVLLLWQVLYIGVLFLGHLNFWKSPPLLWLTLILIVAVAADRLALIPFLGEVGTGPLAYGKILIVKDSAGYMAWYSRYGKCFSLLIIARALIAQLRLSRTVLSATQSEIAD